MRKPVQMIWSGSRFQHKMHLNRGRCALISNGEQLTKTQNRNPLRLRFGINFRLVAYIHIFLLLFLFIFAVILLYKCSCDRRALDRVRSIRDKFRSFLAPPIYHIFTNTYIG